MRRNRTKPLSPELIALRAAERRAAEREAAKRPDAWGANVESLARQPDVTTIKDRRGRVQTAQRTDVFDRLLARQALSQGAHQAIRRLDADMTERRGEGERGAGERVDVSGSRDLVTQRMIDAGDRVDNVFALVGQRDRILLKELLEPRQVMVGDGFERWRQVVSVMTGETNAHAQTAAIRSACENLILAYREIDHSPRKAA